MSDGLIPVVKRKTLIGNMIKINKFIDVDYVC